MGIVAHRIVILGAGTGGTLTANRLRKVYDRSDATITVVDQDDQHVYQPGLLFVPFGTAHPEDIVRPRARQLHKGIDYHQSPIDRVDLDADTVHLADGTELGYDVLVVATGATLLPEETEGLEWSDRVHTFYTLDGATRLHEALESFEGGRVVVNVIDMPIKCPVAPLEFCFLADWYFHERGIRDQVELTYVTPLDAAFTKPVAASTLGGMLGERGIELVTEFNTGEVDGDGGRLVSYDEREVPFDLAVVIPLHGGQSYVERSEGLGDALNFVPTDPATLQSQARANVFAIGDATDDPCVQGRLGDPLRGRGPGRERAAVPRRRGARRHLRRPRQLLHRDRLRQGDAHRLQLRAGAGARPLPCVGRPPAAQGVADEPPGQAHVPDLLLALPAARPGHPRHRCRHADPRQAPERTDPLTEDHHMPTTTVNGTAIETTDDGFFVDPEQWTEEMAPELARAEGIDPLTDQHWQVIRFMRSEYFDKGTGPSVRVLGKTSGVSVKELYQLFPKGPAKIAARVAGIPKPRGCI